MVTFPQPYRKVVKNFRNNMTFVWHGRYCDILFPTIFKKLFLKGLDYDELQSYSLKLWKNKFLASDSLNLLKTTLFKGGGVINHWHIKVE